MTTTNFYRIEMNLLVILFQWSPKNFFLLVTYKYTKYQLFEMSDDQLNQI